MEFIIPFLVKGRFSFVTCGGNEPELMMPEGLVKGSLADLYHTAVSVLLDAHAAMQFFKGIIVVQRKLAYTFEDSSVGYDDFISSLEQIRAEVSGGVVYMQEGKYRQRLVEKCEVALRQFRTQDYPNVMAGRSFDWSRTSRYVGVSNAKSYSKTPSGCWIVKGVESEIAIRLGAANLLLSKYRAETIAAEWGRILVPLSLFDKLFIKACEYVYGVPGERRVLTDELVKQLPKDVVRENLGTYVTGVSHPRPHMPYEIGRLGTLEELLRDESYDENDSDYEEPVSQTAIGLELKVLVQQNHSIRDSMRANPGGDGKKKQATMSKSRTRLSYLDFAFLFPGGESIYSLILNLLIETGLPAG